MALLLVRPTGDTSRDTCCLWPFANDREFCASLKGRKLSWHETFSSEVREVAFSPYLFLSASQQFSWVAPGSSEGHREGM